MTHSSSASIPGNAQAGPVGGKIRVLVVDDSPLARDIITSILEEDPGIEVVDQAENGKIAVEMTAALHPDLVTMDIMMPVMDGLEAISQIMAYHPTPILVVTSSGEASVAYRAISTGALEVMQKPDLGTGPTEWERFTRRVRLLAQVQVATHIAGRHVSTTRTLPVMPTGASLNAGERLVAVGASTGGPAALARLLADLPPNLTAGVVVVQHIADGFVPGLVSWLNSVSSLPVKEVEREHDIQPGTIYIAPTGSHTSLVRRGRLTLVATPPVDGQRPAVDVLFNSVERCYGHTAVGVLLTGMGSDGARGLKAIRTAGGHTIAQDAASCVVYGMPRVAVEMDAVDEVLPIDQIAAAVVRQLRGQESITRR